MKLAKYMFCLLFALILSVGASADDCIDYAGADVEVEWEFSVSGGVEGVALDGDVAFTVNDYTLRSVDIDPETGPAQLGVSVLSGDGRDIELSGDFAFVASLTAIEVFDVSDPASMTPAFTQACPARDLAVAGDRLYAAANDQGMHVYEIGVDGALTLLNAYATPGLDCDNIAAQGDLVYLDDANSLLILDVADPAAPAQMGQIVYNTSADGVMQGIAVAGDYAYVLLASSLRVVDVSNSAAPVEVSRSAALDPPCRAIDVDGIHAHVSNADGYYLFNVSNPDNPVLFQTIGNMGGCRGVTVADDRVFIGASDSASGLVAVSAELSDDLTWVGHAPVGEGDKSGFDVAGDLALVAIADYGLKAFDVSDPTQPVAAGEFELADVTGVVINGDVAYVGDDCDTDNPGLRVVDVSDPAAMHVVGHVALGTESHGMELAADLLYIGTGEGLAICDVSVPSAPVVLGQWRDLDRDVYSVTVDENHAYLVDQYTMLSIVDVSDPAAPAFTGGQWEVTVWFGTAVRDDVLFVPGFTRGCHLWDVSDPVSPNHIETVDTNTHLNDIVLDGDFAYAATGAGMAVFDIEDLGNVTRLGCLPGYASDWICCSDGLLYAVDDHLQVALPQCGGMTAINDPAPAPNGLRLASHPNPFNPTTAIDFTLPESGRVELSIFDVAGRRVRALLAGERRAGAQNVVWDGRDDTGAALPSGIYFARVEAAGHSGNAKLVLLK